MAHNRKNNIKVIEQMLESDDELPDSCHEQPETPSYANDERFDKLRFDWIYEKEISFNASNVPETHINTIENIENNFDALCNLNNGMPKMRILKKKDLYCLQSVQNLLSGNVLVWFADFLMFKDMQSKYKVNNGCLVYKYAIDECEQHEHTTINLKNNQKPRCKIIVRKWLHL